MYSLAPAILAVRRKRLSISNGGNHPGRESLCDVRYDLGPMRSYMRRIRARVRYILNRGRVPRSIVGFLPSDMSWL